MARATFTSGCLSYSCTDFRSVVFVIVSCFVQRSEEKASKALAEFDAVAGNDRRLQSKLKKAEAEVDKVCSFLFW